MERGQAGAAARAAAAQGGHPAAGPATSPPEPRGGGTPGRRMEAMVADRIKLLKMEIGNMSDDVLLNNRAMWLKNEELSYRRKSQILRELFFL